MDFVESATAQYRVSRWLADEFVKLDIQPAYQLTDEQSRANIQPRLRVEQPFVDRHGNIAFAVASDAVSAGKTPISIPAAELEMTIPGGPWRVALFAPAEHAGLEPLRMTPMGGTRYRMALPAIQTAGIVYLVRDHPPLLGIPQIHGAAVAVDGHAARVDPNAPFDVAVQFVNTREQATSNGRLRLMALEGWAVNPAGFDTTDIPAGAIRTYHFAVIPPANAAKLPEPDLFPLVVRWSENQMDKAICTSNVELNR